MFFMLSPLKTDLSFPHGETARLKVTPPLSPCVFQHCKSTFSVFPKENAGLKVPFRHNPCFPKGNCRSQSSFPLLRVLQSLSQLVYSGLLVWQPRLLLVSPWSQVLSLPWLWRSSPVLCVSRCSSSTRERGVCFMSRALRAGGIMTATQRVSESKK